MRFFLHDLNSGATPLRLFQRPMALAGWALLHATGLLAQTTDPALQLQSSPLLQEKISPEAGSALPTFVEGDRVSGRPDHESVVEGHAVLRRADLVIKADRMEYDQSTDLARANGNVRINRAGNVYEGPLLELKLGTFEGFFKEPRYELLKNKAHGEAERIDFIDQNKSVISNASFTTCRRLPGPNWLPDWILRATTLELDNEEEVGTVEGALLSFKGIALLPIPYLSFPLGDRRKSGLLPPTLGLDNVNGAEVSVPYYWNIAPNRDATFTPTLMSKRGLNLGSEFRYLEPAYAGQVRLDLMPVDQLRERHRWGLSYEHQALLKNQLTNALTDAGASLNLNLNRVSDDDYWRDFSGTSTSLTPRLLSNAVSVTWTKGNFSNAVRSVKWQTLQDVTAPIVPPYDRLPQLATHYGRSNVNGFDYSVDLDYTRFQADRSLTAQPNAKRLFSWVQLSRPWIAPAGFITPKLQWHASKYQFDAPLGDGATSAARVLPTFSLDSGLVFERDASYFGRSFRQTLEPRAFYVNTPYRDQSLLPNYDSGITDFNFASIYTENAFVGNDRISDSNLLTLGVSSRLLDPATGAEAVRVGVAQRLFSWLQISRPWVVPAGFITPKLALHASRYQFGAALADGAMSATRVLPTFSLDSGLVFERDASYFGRNFRQTLEPRAFYVNTPYRDQSLLPNYDSGTTDFNFASIYTENAFVGNDRISDSNLLTLGVSSRLLDPATGAEAVRVGVAQRLRFKDQNVTLPGGSPAAERLSDILLGATINWDPTWAFDSSLQFNPKTEQSVRSTIGARYNPGNYRTVTAAYRYQRDASEQIDVGWQWPINDLWGSRGQDLGAGQGQGEGRWYSVGRLNYSLNERKLVDSIIGIEYDAGCWLGRAVWERLQTSTSSATQRIMFQLEFVGFTRLGVSPLKTLKDNIPNYQYLREQVSSPSRFSNYE